MRLTTKIYTQDYHAFGSVMAGRSFSNEKYRFGFNGIEKDNETFTDAYDFGARILDTRIGRWLALDPLASKYAEKSPYIFVRNCPLIFIDPDGKDEYLVVKVIDNNGNVMNESKTLISKKYHETEFTDSDNDKYNRYYDIYHFQILSVDINGDINRKLEQSEISKEFIQIAKPWGSQFAAKIWRKLKNFESHRSGIMLTSADGGVSAGKEKEVLVDAFVNVDVLLAALGSVYGVTVPKVTDLANQLSSIILKMKEVKENNKKKEKANYEIHTEDKCTNPDCPRNDAKKLTDKPDIKHKGKGKHDKNGGIVTTKKP